jgi:hypothetical protein
MLRGPGEAVTAAGAAPRRLARRACDRAAALRCARALTPCVFATRAGRGVFPHARARAAMANNAAALYAAQFGGAAGDPSAAAAALQQQHAYAVQHQAQAALQAHLRQFWVGQAAEMEATTDFKNHNLPLARIKKIMKSDEDVRMISSEAPALFAKACEMFILEARAARRVPARVLPAAGPTRECASCQHGRCATLGGHARTAHVPRAAAFISVWLKPYPRADAHGARAVAARFRCAAHAALLDALGGEQAAHAAAHRHLRRHRQD